MGKVLPEVWRGVRPQIQFTRSKSSLLRCDWPIKEQCYQGLLRFARYAPSSVALAKFTVFWCCLLAFLRIARYLPQAATSQQDLPVFIEYLHHHHIPYRLSITGTLHTLQCPIKQASKFKFRSPLHPTWPTSRRYTPGVSWLTSWRAPQSADPMILCVTT